MPSSLRTLTCLVAIGLLGLPVAARAAGNAYVADDGSGAVSQYAIGATGLLAPLGPPSVAAAGSPSFIVVSPGGRHVYVSATSSATVAECARDPATGRLTPLTPAAVFAGFGPRDLAMTPDGRSLYVADQGS